MLATLAIDSSALILLVTLLAMVARALLGRIALPAFVKLKISVMSIHASCGVSLRCLRAFAIATMPYMLFGRFRAVFSGRFK